MRYGYSGNDPRFLTATLSQILTDQLELDAMFYLQEFESHDEETNEFVKNRELNPDTADDDEQTKLAEQLNRALGIK